MSLVCLANCMHCVNLVDYVMLLLANKWWWWWWKCHHRSHL